MKMAKQKGPNSVPNRHIYTRASYLYQAAQYLASQQPQGTGTDPTEEPATEFITEEPTSHQKPDTRRQNGPKNLSRQMLTDMRIVTQKILIRQSPDLKRTICKFCDTLQIEGQTSSSSIENTSRGGRKPWADVLAIRCGTCGHVKRFPVSVARQKRRPIRHEEAKGEARSDQMVSDAVT